MEWYNIIVLTVFIMAYLLNGVFRHIVNQIIIAVLKGLIWVFGKIDGIGRAKTATLKTAKLTKVPQETKMSNTKLPVAEINDVESSDVIDTSKMSDEELKELQQSLRHQKIELAQ